MIMTINMRNAIVGLLTFVVSSAMLGCSSDANNSDETTADDTPSLYSDPAETIVISYPVSNAIIDLNVDKDIFGSTTPGMYSRKIGLIVNDKYGNAVADGTIVYLSVIDTIFAQSATGETDASAPFANTTAANVFYDAAPFDADSVAVQFDSVTVQRNEAPRYIKTGDLLLISGVVTGDKSRLIDKTVAWANNIIGVDSGYTNSNTGLTYRIGASLLGATIYGYDEDTPAATVGVVFTKDGMAEARLVYPANYSTILTGCGDPSLDTRVSPTGSGDVFIVATTGDNSVTTISAGACFSAIAPSVLTATPTVISGTGNITLELKDGGDGILLPFIDVSASVNITKNTGALTVSATDCTTGLYGACSSTITVGGGATDDAATITYTAADGVTATVTLTIP